MVETEGMQVPFFIFLEWNSRDICILLPRNLNKSDVTVKFYYCSFRREVRMYE